MFVLVALREEARLASNLAKSKDEKRPKLEEEKRTARLLCDQVLSELTADEFRLSSQFETKPVFGGYINRRGLEKLWKRRKLARFLWMSGLFLTCVKCRRTGRGDWLKAKHAGFRAGRTVQSDSSVGGGVAGSLGSYAEYASLPVRRLRYYSHIRFGEFVPGCGSFEPRPSIPG